MALTCQVLGPVLPEVAARPAPDPLEPRWLCVSSSRAICLEHLGLATPVIGMARDHLYPQINSYGVMTRRMTLLVLALLGLMVLVVTVAPPDPGSRKGSGAPTATPQTPAPLSD